MSPRTSRLTFEFDKSSVNLSSSSSSVAVTTTAILSESNGERKLKKPRQAIEVLT